MTSVKKKGRYQNTGPRDFRIYCRPAKVTG
jgi:hypothetical protein